MPLADETEEVLQSLYSLEEEGVEEADAETILARARTGGEALRSAVSAGLVLEGPAGFRLSETGRTAARTVVRRHRLAERLLRDVLHVSPEASESAACEFEHTLADEVTDSICTLLGHPRACPHGKPIPPGPCCDRRRRELTPVVERLSELPAGTSGTVAYVHTDRPGRLDRLAAFGLFPGTPIHLHQTWPSLVVSLGETRLALDRETAEDIYVRLAPREAGGPARKAPGGPGGAGEVGPGRGRRRRRGWGPFRGPPTG